MRARFFLASSVRAGRLLSAPRGTPRCLAGGGGAAHRGAQPPQDVIEKEEEENKIEGESKEKR